MNNVLNKTLTNIKKKKVYADAQPATPNYGQKSETEKSLSESEKHLKH